MFHFIKLGKKLEFENKRGFFFEFLMFHFIKLGKKLEFENKRVFFLNYNVLLYKVRKKVRI